MRKILIATLAIIGFAAITVEAGFAQKKVQALAQYTSDIKEAKI